MSNPPEDLRYLLTHLCGESSRMDINGQIEDESIADHSRAHLQRIRSLLNQELTLDERLNAFSKYPPEQVAAYVDGALGERESEAFETECLKSAALMQELFSLVTPDESTEGLDAFQGNQTEQKGTNGDIAKNRLSTATEIQIAPAPVSKTSYNSKRSYTQLLVVAAAGALLLLGWNWWTQREKPPGEPTQNEIAVDNPPSPQGDVNERVTVPRNNLDMESIATDPTRVLDPRRPLVRAPESDQKITSNDLKVKDRIAPDAPEMDRQMDSPERLKPSGNIQQWLVLKSVDGIALKNDSANSSWQGIHHNPSQSSSIEPESTQSERAAVATLSRSRIQAETSDKSSIILDQNTVLTLSRNSDLASAKITYKIDYGRIMLADLMTDQRLDLVLQGHPVTLTVQRDKTTVEIDCRNSNTLLTTTQGQVNANSLEIPRRKSAKLNAQGEVEKALHTAKSENWATPPIDEPFPKDIADRFNHARKFLAQANALAANPNPLLQGVAVECILAMETLDPRSTGPDALIPLLDSNNPLILTQCALWLESTYARGERFGL
ncbi:MAG: hypothetical protein VX694_00210, partial [Planctomycetota bacterium]|nr:hypothetical protein [Planctomycetota bacterium]